jgi:hypothetical protein
MKIMEVVYSPDEGEAAVLFTEDFFKLPRIIQLDCLVDAKFDTDRLYDSLLKEDEKA